MNPTLAQLEAAAKSSLPPRALHVEPPIPMRTADEAGHTRKESQATQLVALASQRGMFFHSSDQEPFAEIQCGDHREVWPIKSKTFRHWLAGVFYQAKNSAVGGQGMQDALAVMSSMALFDGPEKEVSLRVAGSNEGIYYDIGNADWQAVHVTACGWEIINVVPVAFRRSKGMTALPTPTRGGSVELLRDVLNVADDTQWTLLVGFVLASLRPSGPYPVLVLDGEQGTGKTFIAHTIKSLIDPALAGNRGAPRDTRDLMIAATNGWMLSFDNLSRISHELSDGLCRLSTGGGLATRELYADADETIFDAQRPVLINGIGAIVTRADLLDRSVILTLAPISGEQRREEKVLEARLKTILPLVLGALLDAVCHGLRTVETVRLPVLPRMADFAVWITACAPALGWEPDRFMDAYCTNRSDAVEIGLETSPLVAPLRTLMLAGPWEGTASELLARLTDLAPDSVKKTRAWPSAANTLSNGLRRIAPALRSTGIAVIWLERSGQGRALRIEENGFDRHDRHGSSQNSSRNQRDDDHDDQIHYSSKPVTPSLFDGAILEDDL